MNTRLDIKLSDEQQLFIKKALQGANILGRCLLWLWKNDSDSKFV